MALKITPVGKKAEVGVEVPYRGVKLTIARDTNTKYRSAFRRLTRPYQQEMKDESLDEETSELVLCQALAEGVLVGWDVSTFPGSVPYTKADATDLLQTDSDCRNFVMKFAADINNFIEEDIAQVEKES